MGSPLHVCSVVLDSVFVEPRANKLHHGWDISEQCVAALGGQQLAGAEVASKDLRLELVGDPVAEPHRAAAQLHGGEVGLVVGVRPYAFLYEPLRRVKSDRGEPCAEAERCRRLVDCCTVTGSSSTTPPLVCRRPASSSPGTRISSHTRGAASGMGPSARRSLRAADRRPGEILGHEIWEHNPNWGERWPWVYPVRVDIWVDDVEAGPSPGAARQALLDSPAARSR
jgi:hypothetical protein